MQFFDRLIDTLIGTGNDNLISSTQHAEFTVVASPHRGLSFHRLLHHKTSEYEIHMIHVYVSR